MKRKLLLLGASVTTMTAAATGAVSAVTTPEPARSLHLVALHGASGVATITDVYGKGALWAYDPSAGRYRSLAAFSPSPGATLYVEAGDTPALQGDLNALAGASSEAGRGLSATVGDIVTGNVAAAVVATRLRHYQPKTTTTTTAAPSTPPTTKAPAAPATTVPTTQPTPPPPSGGGAPAGSPEPPSSDPGPWTLVFDDEFNGSSLDTANWTPYWFTNGSTSNETVMDASNVSVSNGVLNLELNPSSGGLVSSNGHFQFTYGYVEARVYLPASGSEIANWPAVWTDGQNWPADGEMDIMEGLGGQACFHFHSDAGGPGGCASGSFTGWHTFGADWEPGSVTYYYDGQDVGSITTGITSSPMYLILENSGGSYGGPSVTPSDMQVDYVRVWQHG